MPQSLSDLSGHVGSTSAASFRRNSHHKIFSKLHITLPKLREYLCRTDLLHRNISSYDKILRIRRGSATACLLVLWVPIPPWVIDVCLLWVLCVLSASGWSLVQRSLTDSGVSECDRKASTSRRPWAHYGLSTHRKRTESFHSGNRLYRGSYLSLAVELEDSE